MNRTGRSPVVCCVDGRYVLPLCVLMESMAAAPGHAGLRMQVLHHGISGASRGRLAFHAGRLGIELEARQVEAGTSAPASGWVSEAVYLRLEIGEALGPSGTVLYLDADTLVLGDLGPLLEARRTGCSGSSRPARR
jgi:lipopolysaccharide biosynthesis glycosyltransferase